jgi:hypothetical protein
MTQTPGIPTRANQTLLITAASELDIERICREYGGAEAPPEAFIVSSKLIEGQLLAVNLEFLEVGQQLPCPGLPLAGAAFDPDWGFSQVEVGLRRDGSAEFRLPSIHFESLASGDMHGYRFCILDDYEVPEVIGQLTHIRGEFARRRSETQKHEGVRVTITQV